MQAAVEGRTNVEVAWRRRLERPLHATTTPAYQAQYQPCRLPWPAPGPDKPFWRGDPRKKPVPRATRSDSHPRDQTHRVENPAHVRRSPDLLRRYGASLSMMSDALPCATVTLAICSVWESNLTDTQRQALNNIFWQRATGCVIGVQCPHVESEGRSHVSPW